MKPSLQLKFGQQLTMTLQLQQAIRLLQLSTLELQQEIQEALDANPLLEQSEEEQSASEQDSSKETLQEDTSSVDTSEAMQQESISEEMPIDTTWDEVVSAAPVTSTAIRDDDDNVYQGETSDSLQDHLRWQLDLTPMTDVDRAIAMTIIDGIDDAGYLSLTAEEVLESQGNPELELDEVEAVLKRIQLFDPIGVGSRSIPECLTVQLKQFEPDTPWQKEALLVVNNHMDLLANRDFRTLMRRARLKEDQLREVMRLIQSLNPRPGNAVLKEDDHYIIPDVSVLKKNGVWQVELNPDAVPKIRVNAQYAAMSRSVRSSSDSQFIRSHVQEAKWFIKSLESRNDTLLKVANCILRRPVRFLRARR